MSISATPGTPPITLISIDNRLIGMYTPVKQEQRSTMINARAPIIIEISARFTGCFFLDK